MVRLVLSEIPFGVITYCKYLILLGIELAAYFFVLFSDKGYARFVFVLMLIVVFGLLIWFTKNEK